MSPSTTRNHIYNVFRRIKPVTVTVHEHSSKVHHEPKHVLYFCFKFSYLAHNSICRLLDFLFEKI